MWRFLFLTQTMLMLTAGIHHVVWVERPSILMLLPQYSVPGPGTGTGTTATVEYNSGSGASDPMSEANVSAVTAYQPHPPASCGQGFFFTRKSLTGPAVVVSIQRQVSNPSTVSGVHRLPSTSRVVEVASKMERQKSCIAQTFHACGLNTSTTPRMGDLLTNGSFVPVVTNRNTGENAMTDPAIYTRYFLAFECIGVYKAYDDPYASAGKWEEKAMIIMHAHPVLTPLHGGVSPARIIAQAQYLLKIAGATSILQILTTKPKENPAAVAASVLNGSTYNIVELGCGHAALLASMCPPVKGVHCYGSDFSPKLIEVGRRHFPWIQLEAHTKAPSVPTGWANLSISHGVLLCLRLEDVCDHILEGLRVLQPGGKFVLWTLWATPFGSATRLHPGFFVSGVPWDKVNASGYKANTTDNGHDGEMNFLPYCSNNIGVLVDRVDLWLADESASIYPPRLNRGGPYGVILRRSSAHVGSPRTKRQKQTLDPSSNIGNPFDTARQHLLRFFFPSVPQTPTIVEAHPHSASTSPGISPADETTNDNSTAAYFRWYRRYSTLRRYDKRQREWVTG